MFPPTQYKPVNKTITPQQSFFSTCKRQKTSSVRLAKTKNKEKEKN